MQYLKETVYLIGMRKVKLKLYQRMIERK